MKPFFSLSGRLTRISLVIQTLALASGGLLLMSHVSQAFAQPSPSTATPNSPQAAAEPRFDLSVNNAPAAQVFMQIGAGTPYSMLVAPDLAGSISVTLKAVTVLEALDTMRELYGYDYKIVGRRVFIYSNALQTRLFSINYLPGRRQGASDIRVTSSSISQSSSVGNGGTSSNGLQPQTSSNGGQNGQGGTRSDDSAHVRTTSDADFWREVQASLSALVGTGSGRSVVLNPSAGVIVVKAPPVDLRQVEAYLKAVQISIERQVMIEAKIVEVSLSDDAQSGVNWGAFGRALGGARGGNVAIGIGQPGSVVSPTGSLSSGNVTVTTGAGGSIVPSSLGQGFYGLAFQSANFAALLNFLETQGDVHVMSSPRIATLNNQKAVLKVGSDELYVTGLTTTTATNTNNNNASTSPSLSLQPFFSGIALDVTPQIDAEGHVMLHVHPAISVVNEKQKVLDLGALGSYRLPLAASSINETDSIVRVRDGQIVAIGGLMTQTQSNDRNGLPGLSRAPVVGSLFGQTSRVNHKRELIILMKPTVIKDDKTWPESVLPEAAAAKN